MRKMTYQNFSLVSMQRLRLWNTKTLMYPRDFSVQSSYRLFEYFS